MNFALHSAFVGRVRGQLSLACETTAMPLSQQSWCNTGGMPALHIQLRRGQL